MAKRTKRTPDDWDWEPPPGQKIAVAFGFIWFIVSLAQLFLVLKRLKAIPSMAARGPYIILSVATFSLGVYELLHAIFLQTADNPEVAFDPLLTARQFFWIVDTALRPSVVLYLVHQRGDVLRAVKGNMTIPLSTRIWKRITDWVLVATALIMYLGSMGAWRLVNETFSLDHDQIYNLYGIYLGLGQTALAFLILLCIDVGVSLTFQIIQGKGTHDPVLAHLMKAILPLFCVYLFEVGFFDIFPLLASYYDGYFDGEGYSYTNAIAREYDYWAFTASNIFFDGAVRIAITAVLILTMTLPGVSWTPLQVVTQEEIPGTLRQSPNSSPIKADFTPQQQPASYWPQPHVLPHELPLGMSQQGNPYALPAGPEATRPVIQQPVAEIYSTTPPATTQAMTYQQPVTEIHSTTPRAPTQVMPYQPLYPSSTRALPYQSAPPESTQPPTYRSPWPGSTQPLPYQIPPPVKAAPKQSQSVSSPTGELLTHALLPEEKKEKE